MMTPRKTLGYALLVATVTAIAVGGSIAAGIWWAGPAAVLAGFALASLGYLIGYLTD